MNIRPPLPWSCILLTLGLAGLPSLSSAQGLPLGGPPWGGPSQGQYLPPPPPGQPGPLPMPPWLRGVALGEAQQDAVFDLALGLARELREEMKVVDRVEAELRALGLAPDYDEARARALAERLGIALARSRLIRANTDRRILALLNPEQRRQAALSMMEPEGAGCPPGPPPRSAPPMLDHRGPGEPPARGR